MRLINKPVCDLIGNCKTKIRVYGSTQRQITPADEVDRFKKLIDDSGFNAFKFRIGSEVGRNLDEWKGDRGNYFINGKKFRKY